MPDFFYSSPNPSQGKFLTFEDLLKILQELLIRTGGNFGHAMEIMERMLKNTKPNPMPPDYSLGDFVDELKEKGYITTDGQGPTKKMDIAIRRDSLKDIFKDAKRGKTGQHTTRNIGKGDEFTSDIKPFEFGDSLEHLAVTNSIRNAQVNHGIEDFQMTQEDLEVFETHKQSQTSSVLMLDISHSMILYGEDRITPAKKVALALAEYVSTRFPKDSLDFLTFGDAAVKIELSDIPYLEVGPFHTNTVAGLEMAINILRKRKNPNKQIFMITDGKPSCMMIGKRFYKNSWGLDEKIIKRCLALAHRCKTLGISITTFMIARDPYLVQFVEEFTRINGGKAYYSSLGGLGNFVLENYKK